MRKRLAVNLNATISQRLIPAQNQVGLVAAQEIMINGPGIRESILGTEPLSQITRIIAKGRSHARGLATQTFDQHVFELLYVWTIICTPSKATSILTPPCFGSWINRGIIGTWEFNLSPTGWEPCHEI